MVGSSTNPTEGLNVSLNRSFKQEKAQKVFVLEMEKKQKPAILNVYMKNTLIQLGPLFLVCLPARSPSNSAHYPSPIGFLNCCWGSILPTPAVKKIVMIGINSQDVSRQADLRGRTWKLRPSDPE